MDDVTYALIIIIQLIWMLVNILHGFQAYKHELGLY